MNVNVPAAPTPAIRSRVRAIDYIALLKLRLNSLVIAAVAVGYLLASPGSVSAGGLALLLLGILLASGGSSAINMAIEGSRDRLMDRTRGRPVPAGRVSPEEAAWFGAAISLAGLAIVAASNNWLAALLTAATILLYVLAYTPLKPLTTWNTWVGAVPGALPPLIGWAAASGSIEPRSLALFGIVFFWQFPHFYAIASVYRDDYKRGGFAMLPVVDKKGLRTAHQVITTALALIPVSLLPAVLRMAGPAYFAGALVLGASYLVFSLRASIVRNTESWRDLLRVSLLVLPGIFVLLVADRLHP